MNINWTWLIVGLLLGVFFSSTIKGFAGKATGQ
jgi:preprotein translocase subunit SecD